MQGAEYVDLEARAAFTPEMIRTRGGRRLIVSSHLFGPMPDDLEQQWDALQASGAEIAKLAVEAHSLTDTLRLMKLGGRPGAEAGAPGHVLIAMGDAGVASRILATRIGNAWTYAGDNVAPGQVSPARLVNEFRFRDLTPHTAVYGVVGNPDHALAVAGDAQRRLPLSRDGCRLPAAPGGGRRRLRHVRPRPRSVGASASPRRSRWR